MIAGIGNIFLQDDAFGTAVIRQVEEKGSLQNVEINNVGTGGLKLAYDLMKGYDGLVLIDASRRGEEPGTLYIIEPNEQDIPAVLEEGSFIDPHGADPATVLRFIRALNAWPGKVVIVACEPAAAEEFAIGLSDSVAASVEKAVQLVEDIVREMNEEINK